MSGSVARPPGHQSPRLGIRLGTPAVEASGARPQARGMSTTSTQSDRAPSIHELDGLLDFVPVAGPPAVLLAGPLVLFALAVAGPFLVIVTLAVVLVLAMAVVAIAGL